MAGRGGAPEARSGVAIVAVVLLMLAMTVLAHGLLTLARLEHAASRAGVRVLRARLAAETAVHQVAVDAGSAGREGTPIWGVSDSIAGVLVDSSGAYGPGRPVPDSIGYSGRLLRLSREIWLAEGEADVGRLARRRVARPVWVLDPAARVAGAEAVVVVGDTRPTAIEGVVDVGTFLERPAVEPPEGCSRWLASVDSVRSGRTPSPLSSVPDAVAMRLDRVSFDSLIRRIPTRVSGVGTPTPDRRGSECLTADPWNWGDPGGHGRPCGRHVIGVVVDHGTRVEAGVGQGLLLIDGEATLVDADFSGVVLSSGRLTLAGRTTLRGLVRAAGGVELAAGARIEASACWAAAALAHPALRIPVPIPESGWVTGR